LADDFLGVVVRLRIAIRGSAVMSVCSGRGRA
jgi:hypothetical protein